MTVRVLQLDRAGRTWAQQAVTLHHYRRRPVPGRACPEAWGVHVEELGRVGCLIVGRPQATVCRPWYGSVEDARSGRCDVTRWQVLNLARVWLDPSVQLGGEHHRPELLPGFVDRRGRWRSTLASEAIRQLADVVGLEYLLSRPPVFLDEPFEMRWLLSYCDTREHRGVIYRAAGFELYRTNAAGLQTWRKALPRLTEAQDERIAEASARCPRARTFRSERAARVAQLPLDVAA